MTLITFQDGKPVMRDGKVGTEQACCCGGGGGQEKDCCLSLEYADCEIDIVRLYSGGGSFVIDTVPAANLFLTSIGGGCRFQITLADENPNGDKACRINGEIDPDIEDCAACEEAGGECVLCCDSPRLVAEIVKTEDNQCEISTQTVENCSINATTPIGPCDGYQMILNCNPLP